MLQDDDVNVEFKACTSAYGARNMPGTEAGKPCVSVSRELLESLHQVDVGVQF